MNKPEKKIVNIIVIDDCIKCKYATERGDIYICDHPKVDKTYQKVDLQQLDKIPCFCPLEDFKDA